MDPATLLRQPAALEGQLARARVTDVRPDALIAVTLANQGSLLCDPLVTGGAGELVLAPGDTVLVWLPGPEGGRGVVLGRIGPSRSAVAPAGEVPDQIVLKARKGLTLQCGEGSITLRGDGRVLIKGKDLVSRAQNTNRIKGGTVAIN